MPDYKYLNPKSQGKPKLGMRDMDQRVFFERPKTRSTVKSFGYNYNPWVEHTLGGRKYPG